MRRESRGVRDGQAGLPYSPLDRTRDVPVARETHPATFRIPDYQALSHGRGRRPGGHGPCHRAPLPGEVFITPRFRPVPPLALDARAGTAAADGVDAPPPGTCAGTAAGALGAPATVSGSSFAPVGPTWISVPIAGHTPHSKQGVQRQSSTSAAPDGSIASSQSRPSPSRSRPPSRGSPGRTSAY